MRATGRTKIVATLGPASESPEVIGRMLEAGLDVVRLNFSHGSAADHERRLATARREADARGVPLAALQDLPGPKLRIGPLPGERVMLAAGQEVTLIGGRPAAGTGQIPVAYAHLADDVRPGDHIYLQDGEIAVAVVAVEPPAVRCAVESGGILRQHAGLNLPGVRLSVPSVTDDDLRCLEWGIGHGVEFVGLSFIETADEIDRVRHLLRERRCGAHLVAKIERRLALEHIDEIVNAADGVMVARGDLAVETSIEDVPVVQKSIIALCNRLGKPVITATQMLESMVQHPRPTRAEAADVANAVFDGTDALMLSGETAIGAYPAEAVATMAAIAERAETVVLYDELFAMRAREHGHDTSEAIALAACQAASTIGAAAIVAATESGSTARRVSRLRTRTPIVAATHSAQTWRQLSLVWGVRAVLVDQARDVDALVAQAVRAAAALGIAGPGDHVIVTAGIPIGQPGTTNFLKVVTVD